MRVNHALKALGFLGKFINWISLCITSASFSVQVNSELTGYFQSKRGLRQDYLLSPYLFAICMNVLSKMFNEAAIKGRIWYHPRCKNIDLTHIFFANDLMIADGTKNSIEGILKVFEAFDKMIRLKISMDNSILFTAGITIQRKEKNLR